MQTDLKNKKTQGDEQQVAGETQGTLSK